MNGERSPVAPIALVALLLVGASIVTVRRSCVAEEDPDRTAVVVLRARRGVPRRSTRQFRLLARAAARLFGQLASPSVLPGRVGTPGREPRIRFVPTEVVLPVGIMRRCSRPAR